MLSVVEELLAMPRYGQQAPEIIHQDLEYECNVFRFGLEIRYFVEYSFFFFEYSIVAVASAPDWADLPLSNL